ncbi:uncharacterized protein LOC114517702 [Dendronephthya gigantea]|uniref:uncharacterized protein LOC114517702 n=1 Tax=Dendronephthya gigantea TaxID=151771 RepID=UPI00106BB109|nr:uncharacterized protein LOC114517702 [Dendronephthya gigantea]
MKVYIGIDVGGTNTDAVVICDRKIIAKSKQPTTSSITDGVKKALSTVLQQLSYNFKGGSIRVCRVNIGTTHFLNAVLQRKNLAAVAVVRLCGPATRALPPFCDFPDDLRTVVDGGYYYIDGGYEFSGEEIRPINRDEVREIVTRIKQTGSKNIVVSGVFSSICEDQEVAVGELIKSEYPQASLTLSHQVANFGLLERENSSILNESLKPLSKTAIAAFTQAIQDAGLNCPIFFTQNDGTIISAEKSSQFPVLTFSSGPTNSMRGAAFLSGNEDAIVVDIGGTTTDVGVLMNGFPRPASTRVRCGGVVTNFRMPDVFSFALGGGSIVSGEKLKPKIGPESVGYELLTKSLVYGGTTCTTTDFAVAAGLCCIGDSSKVAHLDSSSVTAVVAAIRELLEDSIDQVKVKAESQPVILVGGGSVLVDVSKSLEGSSTVAKPQHFEVANAVGAALSQVSGVVDHVVDITKKTREKALEEAQSLAIARAIENGALAETVEIVEKSESQLTYLKGGAARVQVKAVGDLAADSVDDNLSSDLLVCSGDTDFKHVAAEGDPVQPLLGDIVEKGEGASAAPSSSAADTDVNPFIESSGAWLLNEFDVDCIATGAGILGCGGGGNPYLGKLSATSILKSGKEIRVIHPDSLPKNALILPVAFMGAPSVVIEKLISGCELETAAEKVQALVISDEKDVEVSTSKRGVKYVKHMPEFSSQAIPADKKIVAVMSAEIGGMNSIEPLILGAKLGLPVVDCDGMGRAFPELDMFIPYIHGLQACPSAIVGSSTSFDAMTYAPTAKDLENDLRELLVTKMGCFAGLAVAPLKAEDLPENTVRFSMSRAWRLGKAVKQARRDKRCPIEAVLEAQNGKMLISGKVVDVERKTDGGFNKGTVRVEGLSQYTGLSARVFVQNENIIVENISSGDKKEILATVPDLISILDTETGESIPTEEIRYGLRVSVVVLPSPPLLCSERALKVVGPEAFGYAGYRYQPCLAYEETDPIPLIP